MKLATRSPRSVRQPIFSNFWLDDFAPVTRDWDVKTTPAVNIIEYDDRFEVHLAVPGQDKNDFRIHVEDDLLKVELTKSTDVEGHYTKREFKFQPFVKSYRLNDTIDQSTVRASYENGVLRVNLGKREEAKKQAPRAIEVR